MNCVTNSLFSWIAIAGIVTLSACGGNDNNNPDKPAPKPVVQITASATVGNHIADVDGNSLYYFSNDFNGANNCSGGCAAVWPLYYAGDNLAQAALGTGLDIKDFNTITTTDGKKQTTYKGWPLYYYAPNVNGANVREAAGETKGEAVNNVWFVAKTDYSIQLVNAQLVGADGKNYLANHTEGTGKTLYFTDGKGVTLYSFAPDKFNTNKFTKADFSNNAVWPIYETDQIVVPSTLDKTQFGSITVFGKKQLTYKGWPLYYFGQDGGVRGVNKGVSVPSPGVWPVVTKDVPAAPQP
jgi:predicted lipoprotein with Yx(FWY)xxD motif